MGEARHFKLILASTSAHSILTITLRFDDLQ